MYKFKCYYLFFCALVVVTKSQLDIFRPKTVRVYRFKGKCPGNENAPIYYTNIQISNINRIYYLSMKIKITRDITEPLKLHIYLSRCRSRDALDSCETYNTIKINKFCTNLFGKGKPWTPLLTIINPPITSCPMKKGTYRVDNGTFDGRGFDRFPISGFYWKVKAHILDERSNAVLLCTVLEGEIAPI